ncbi:MAG: TetR/AcrR family transcriptional regulator [Deltaproteobacteria bacterium]|nr:MAG: TetR/AcrR family transcriptional regulator [Deltaproteobacteria bacterium]
MVARAQHRVETHARILEAAMAMVVESGFEGLSMRALARRVELTPGALYRYFDGQDALIVALTAQVIDELGAAVSEAVHGVPANRPLLRVLTAAEAYRLHSLAHPNRFGLVSMLLAAPRMLIPERERARPLVDRMLTSLAPLLESFAAAEAAGQLAAGSPIDRAVMCFATIQGMLTLRKQAAHAPELFDPEQLMLEAICSHLVGWGAPHADVARARTDLGGAR